MFEIMDKLDRKLLAHLQEDSSKPIQTLADRIGMSTSACHRRIKILEESGVISGYRAFLDAHKLGLHVEVLVQITLLSQDIETLTAFEEAVDRYSDILDCWLIAGQYDYLLRVMARDIEDYDAIHRDCLSRLPGVSSMHSSFSLRRIKESRGYAL